MFDRSELQKCHTDYGEYMYDFYPRDYDRYKVKKQIREAGFKIVNQESLEEGELITLFLDRK